MTLLAEDLLLLLLDDASGKPVVDGTRMSRVLAGAVLLELALDDVVTPAEPGEDVKKGRLVVREGSMPQDPLLARAVDLIGTSKPMKPEAVIEKLAKNLRDELARRIVDAGWVREEKGKVLGIFPTTRWPEVDGRHECAVRSELSAAILDGVTAAPRTAALVSLLSAVDAAPKLFPDADRRAVKKRAKEIAEGDWAGKAVRKSVEAVNAAIIVAATVPAIVAGSG
ncbi:GPP34 family phosphoprotein [Rhodococcus opacus]|nr:GPP34 family phosphoprotein [Rhodococcus opacus]RZL71066.1 MAG: GPP34 family phosphoprotein [Rhodococcus sp. (in: high G+C Gram-positive bacteria)]